MLDILYLRSYDIFLSLFVAEDSPSTELEGQKRSSESKLPSPKRRKTSGKLCFFLYMSFVVFIVVAYGQME